MTTTSARPNKFAGICLACGGNVPAGTGILGTKVDGRWTVTHTPDGCPTGPTGALHADGCIEAADHVGTTCIILRDGARATVPRGTAVLPATAGFRPTAEQETALVLYATGQSMVIEAGAGTGKTSTLLLLAKSDPSKRVQYVAFNKAIVAEVGAKLPANATASTVHSLAFRAVGGAYKARIDARVRMTSDRVAAILGIDPIYVGDGDARRALNPGFLAGQVMKALNQFCQSADRAPTVRHFAPIDGVDSLRDDGTRSYDVSNMIARTLLPALQKAWADTQRVDGILPFGHNYIKIWQLSNPTISGDVIMFDEAQDASPLLADIVAQQHHAQRVYVGDSAQAIYGFTGAIDAIAGMKAEGLAVANLSQSFRFGPAIAARANRFLDDLDADLRLTGLDSIPSTLEDLDDPDAILTRTNAAAVEAILTARANGVVAHLVGNGKETLAFARAARDLDTVGTTSYGDLACFSSWAEVVAYSEQDALGEDLALNVKLVEKFTADVIIEALSHMPREDEADLVVSTAHKSKGREWDRVRIASDFVPQTKPGEEPRDPSHDEIRLRYVACTRAKLTLDCTALDDKKEQAA